jgi:hypothetical protein|tara:strand:+ start:8729 stop:8902 length:174 start_codon:yes stop_codon:yes gene_type:complete
MTSDVIEVAQLQAQVMYLYCPWYGSFTTNTDDTKQKLSYWHAVRVMTTKELLEHIKG